MGCIIIALPKKEDARRIAELIKRRESDVDIFLCSSASSVLREANERDDGVVLCTARLKDMSYAELAEYLPGYFQMIVMSKNEGIELLNDRMHHLVLPLRGSDLMELLQKVLRRSAPQRKVRKKVPIKRNPEQQKVIDQAKHILMEKQNLTEPEAYRFLQKQSMDQGRTLLESAQMLLLLNEDWTAS